jgi:hypothetical protein
METAAFKIKESSIAYNILSKGLYSRKIECVIREISTNAADEHKLHNINQPFEVHLPTGTNPVFWVRDYAKGLSHDNVMNLYTTCFDSTKRGSSEFDGMLGLGSKSPFTVADEFTITSWFEGKKSVYLCYKQHDNPFIKRIMTCDSNEPSGLKVEVKPNSSYNYVWDWQRYARRVYKFFKNKPTIVSSSTIDMELEKCFTSNELLGQSATNPWSMHNDLGESYAVMGNVAYPINFMQIDVSEDEEPYVNIVRDTSNLVIHFNRGEVHFTPNREALQYDAHTQSALKKVCKDIVCNVIDDLKACSKIPDLFEARKTFAIKEEENSGVFSCNESFKKYMNKLMKEIIHEATGENLFPNGEMKTVCQVQTTHLTKDGSRVTSRDKDNIIYNFQRNEKIFYFGKKKQLGRVKGYMVNNNISYANLVDKQTATHLASVLGIGNHAERLSKFIDVDTLPATSNRSSIKVSKHLIHENGFVNLEVKSEIVLLDDHEYFFIIRKNKKYYMNSHEVSQGQIISMIQGAKKIGIALPEYVITMTASEAKNHGIYEDGNFVNFLQHLARKAFDYLKSHEDFIYKILNDNCWLNNQYDIPFPVIGWNALLSDHPIRNLENVILTRNQTHDLDNLFYKADNQNGTKILNNISYIYSSFCTVLSNRNSSNRYFSMEDENVSIDGRDVIVNLNRYSWIYLFKAKGRRIETNVLEFYKIVKCDFSSGSYDNYIKDLNDLHSSGMMRGIYFREIPAKRVVFKWNIQGIGE